MRAMLSAALIATFSTALNGAPLMAAAAARPSAPLGVVLMAKKTHYWPNPIYCGATIYDGDRLKTKGDETLMARLGSGQVVLDENSSAIVHSALDGLSVELEDGAVVFSSGEDHPFQVLADGATIRALNAQLASAQLVKISDKQLILTITRGALEVTMGEEVKIVEAGTSYRMEVEARESRNAPQSSATQPAAHSHFAQIVVPGIVIPTIFVLIRVLESGDRL